MTTTACGYGYRLSSTHVRNGWYGCINSGECSTEQQTVLVDALMAATEQEFDALLPSGLQWWPATNEVVYEVGQEAKLPGGEEAVELLEQATGAVAERFEVIAAEALARVTAPAENEGDPS